MGFKLNIFLTWTPKQLGLQVYVILSGSQVNYIAFSIPYENQVLDFSNNFSGEMVSILSRVLVSHVIRLSSFASNVIVEIFTQITST